MSTGRNCMAAAVVVALVVSGCSTLVGIADVDFSEGGADAEAGAMMDTASHVAMDASMDVQTPAETGEAGDADASAKVQDGPTDTGTGKS
jgi:hypothetical protein